MKPDKILLFLVWVLGLLLFLTTVFPEKGVVLGERIRFKFPTFKSLFERNKAEYADISNVLKVDTLLSLAKEDTLDNSGIPGADNMAKVNDYHYDTLLTDELRAKLHRIQYPKNNRMVLYPFFRELYLLKEQKKRIRIFHYGDSQLEGDRITSFLRVNLQARFGGSGPGMIAINDLTPTSSINREHSSNWKRFTILGRKDTSATGNVFGPMLSFSRFSSIMKDSVSGNDNISEAWVKLTPSGMAYPSTREFTNVNIYYANNDKAVSIQIMDKDGNEVVNDSMFPEKYLNKLSWQFDDTPDFLYFKFSGTESPDIYCMTLDGEGGVAVDNIPMRGSSGVDFTKTNMKILSQFFDIMNVKLLIMEFGVNVAPNVLSDYTFYENWFYRNLSALKKLDPELCIIVIGISDMSRKRADGDGYETFPNIEKIRDAQKNAAFRAGCAFWDTYAAMGGENSMPSWVFADPPLASKDFTHFNAAGAKIIAKMFYNALIAEYDDYLRYNRLEDFKQTIQKSKVDTPR